MLYVLYIIYNIYMIYIINVINIYTLYVYIYIYIYTYIYLMFLFDVKPLLHHSILILWVDDENPTSYVVGNIDLIDFIDVVLLSLLLTLKEFYTLF